MNDDPSFIDTTRLNELQDLFQVDFAAALTSFIVNATNYATTIGQGLTAADCKTIEHTAHKLKSSAAMFGAINVSAISIDLEAEARRNDLAKIPALYDRLIQELTRSIDYLTAYRAKL